MPSRQFETFRWWSVTATLAASDGDRLARLHFAHPCWQADRFASASDGCPDPAALSPCRRSSVSCARTGNVSASRTSKIPKILFIRPPYGDSTPRDVRCRARRKSVYRHPTEMNSTGLVKRAHIVTWEPSQPVRRILSRLQGRCIKFVSAKFGSSAVENRFRQPASPLLTGSDSSQQKIQIRNRNTIGNRNSKVV